MKRCVLALISLLLGIVSGPCTAKSQAVSSDVTLLSQWVLSLQFTNAALPSYGGLKIHHTAGANVHGTLYYRVVPYDADLAVLGNLRARTTGSLRLAKLWIEWYLAHLTPKSAPGGAPLDHFYLEDGSGETTCADSTDKALCNHVDATDSAAATFLSVLWAAHQSGLSSDYLTANRKQIEDLAGTVLSLQQADGLCWAKADYHIKYLEDNCEVFAGLRDVALLEHDVFHDDVKYRAYLSAALKTRAAILNTFYNSQIQLYRWAKDEQGTLREPDLNVWFPDTQTQMWPILWGVVSPQSTNAQTVVKALEARWNGTLKPAWDTHPDAINGGFIESGAAFAVLLAGGKAQARNYVQAVKQLKFPSSAPRDYTNNFAWPFAVSDAGWLLAILTQLHPS